ncbi:MAG: hypothetical protein K5678_12200 [Acetatifactor sp.]|nr:hypothetical protein [Acetatifactor sp.]
MVLIGIGECLDLGETSIDLGMVIEVLREHDADWLFPPIAEAANASLERNRVALTKLAELIKKKNCFIVSLAHSEYVANIDWREGRLVMPNGHATAVQCSEACEQSEVESLSDAQIKKMHELCHAFVKNVQAIQTKVNESAIEMPLPDEVKRAMRMIQMREQIFGEMQNVKEQTEELLGKCPCCGAQKVLNVAEAKHYDQRGYQKKWEFYSKWLYGSMSRKLLLLRLGGNHSQIQLLREPFEKIAELNPQAKLITQNDENVIDWLEKV